MPLVQTKDGPARLFQFVGKSLDKIIPSSNGCQKFRITNLNARLRGVDYFASALDSSPSKRVYLIIEFGPVDFNVLGNSRETEYEIKTINKNSDPDTYSISRYPLSPSMTCVKVITAFEKALDIF